MPSPRDLPDPGVDTVCPASPAGAGKFSLQGTSETQAGFLGCSLEAGFILFPETSVFCSKAFD